MSRASFATKPGSAPESSSRSSRPCTTRKTASMIFLDRVVAVVEEHGGAARRSATRSSASTTAAATATVEQASWHTARSNPGHPRRLPVAQFRQGHRLVGRPRPRPNGARRRCPIDADLQDPPEVIPALVHEVAGRPRRGLRDPPRSRTSDSLAKRLTANWFYRVHNQAGRHRHPRQHRGLPADGPPRRSRRCSRLPERNRFMKGLFTWVGFQPDRRAPTSATSAGPRQFQMEAIGGFGTSRWTGSPHRPPCPCASGPTSAPAISLLRLRLCGFPDRSSP